jgi:hypothetical protein
MRLGVETSGLLCLALNIAYNFGLEEVLIIMWFAGDKTLHSVYRYNYTNRIALRTARNFCYSTKL